MNPNVGWSNPGSSFCSSAQLVTWRNDPSEKHMLMVVVLPYKKWDYMHKHGLFANNSDYQWVLVFFSRFLADFTPIDRSTGISLWLGHVWFPNDSDWDIRSIQDIVDWFDCQFFVRPFLESTTWHFGSPCIASRTLCKDVGTLCVQIFAGAQRV